jgi:citrate lyase synthetase
MKFESLNEYKNNIKGITILYPGGFKPLTGGHVHIIDQYLKHPDVKRIVLFISPSKRDEVSADTAYKIAKKILKDKNVEIVLDKESYSPILSIYRWIQKPEREPGKYALAASTKGNDYKRVKEFTKNYTPEKFAKNLPKGIEVTELPIDVNPLTYKNGEPISATNVRDSIKEKDYKKFKENYPMLSEDQIKFIWNELTKPDKDIEESGEGSISGRADIYPSEKYRAIKNVYD